MPFRRFMHSDMWLFQDMLQEPESDSEKKSISEVGQGLVNRCQNQSENFDVCRFNYTGSFS